MKWIIGSLLLFVSNFSKCDLLFPVPDHFTINMVSDVIDFNGFDLQPVSFYSSESTSVIIEYYKQEWGEEGVRRSDIPGWTVLSHVSKGMLYTVQIPTKKNIHEKGIEGFLGISNLPSLKKLSRELGEGFPMLSGTKVLNDIMQNDMGKEARTLWLVNEKGIDNNMRKIKNDYEAKGWSVLASEHDGEKGALMMNKNGAQLDLSMQKLGKQTHILAVVMEP